MLKSKALRRGARRAFQAARNRDGVAALEFALIAPLLILLFFGMTELTSAIIAGRHTNHASSAMGDLVAQCSNINDGDLTNIFSASSDIMSPLSTTTMNQRVTSVVATDSSGDTQVQWSQPTSQPSFASTYQPGSSVTIPANLVVNKGDTVIMSEVSYAFTFPVDVLNGFVHFDKVYYFKPRKSTQVVYTGSAANGGTNTNTSCYS